MGFSAIRAIVNTTINWLPHDRYQVSEIRRNGKSWEKWKCLVRFGQTGALSLVLSPIVQCYGYISWFAYICRKSALFSLLNWSLTVLSYWPDLSIGRWLLATLPSQELAAGNQRRHLYQCQSHFTTSSPPFSFIIAHVVLGRHRQAFRHSCLVIGKVTTTT